MSIKNPVVSYGTAHDELKNGDLIPGKAVQLSKDENNLLSIGSDNGLYNRKYPALVGSGWQFYSGKIEHSAFMGYEIQTEYSFFPHIKYTREELKKKRFMIIAKNYFCVEHNQKDFTFSSSVCMNVAHHLHNADTNVPVIVSKGDIDIGQIGIQDYFEVKNKENSINKLPKKIILNNKYYAIVHDSDLCFYPNVYPHMLGVEGRNNVIVGFIRFDFRLERIDPMSMGLLSNYQLYEIF